MPYAMTATQKPWDYPTLGPLGPPGWGDSSDGWRPLQTEELATVGQLSRSYRPAQSPGSSSLATPQPHCPWAQPRVRTLSLSSHRRTWSGTMTSLSPLDMTRRKTPPSPEPMWSPRKLKECLDTDASIRARDVARTHPQRSPQHPGTSRNPKPIQSPPEHTRARPQRPAKTREPDARAEP